jgi:hypothetical protein
MIHMKWLAREAREQTDWARQHLPGLAVTWQFDTAGGLKYVTLFDAADAFAGAVTETIALRSGIECGEAEPRAADHFVTLDPDEGLFGDGALDFLDRVARIFRQAIEGRTGRLRA